MVKVVIIGAGISGLAVAAFLRRRTEAEIVVLERNERIVDDDESTSEKTTSYQRVDYGIAIAPNGSMCLGMLGMQNHADELHGCELHQIVTRSSPSSDDGSQYTYVLPFPGREAFGSPSIFCRRSSLIRWLWHLCTSVDSRTQSRPISVQLNCRIRAIDVQMGTATMEDGTTFTSDVLICADGIAKEGRRAMMVEWQDDEQESREESIAQCLYMTTITPEQIEQRPNLRFLLHPDRSLSPTCTQGMSTLANWFSKVPSEGETGRALQDYYRSLLRVIAYPIDQDGNHQLFAVVPASNVMLAKFGRQKVDKAKETANKSDVPSAAATHRGSVVRQIDSREAYEWIKDSFEEQVRSLFLERDRIDLGLMRDSDPIERWCSPKGGRACLVGDAAHASIPHNGQGAAQALEDAETLSYFLARWIASGDGGVDGLHEAFRAYEGVRVPRAHMMQRSGRLASGQLAGMEHFNMDQYNAVTFLWKGTEAALEQEKSQQDSIAVNEAAAREGQTCR